MVNYSHLATRLKHRASDSSLEWGADGNKFIFALTSGTYLGFAGVNGQSYHACDFVTSGACSVDQCRCSWLFLPANRKPCGFGRRRRSVNQSQSVVPQKGPYTLSMFP